MPCCHVQDKLTVQAVASSAALTGEEVLVLCPVQLFDEPSAGYLAQVRQQTSPAALVPQAFLHVDQAQHLHAD